MTSILTALRALLFASALLSLLLICGCGLKGDLVLPDQADTASPGSEASDEASDDEPENDEDSRE